MTPRWNRNSGNIVTCLVGTVVKFGVRLFNINDRVVCAFGDILLLIVIEKLRVYSQVIFQGVFSGI